MIRDDDEQSKASVYTSYTNALADEDGLVKREGGRVSAIT